MVCSTPLLLWSLHCRWSRRTFSSTFAQQQALWGMHRLGQTVITSHASACVFVTSVVLNLGNTSAAGSRTGLGLKNCFHNTSTNARRALCVCILDDWSTVRSTQPSVWHQCWQQAFLFEVDQRAAISAQPWPDGPSVSGQHPLRFAETAATCMLTIRGGQHIVPCLQ